MKITTKISEIKDGYAGVTALIEESPKNISMSVIHYEAIFRALKDSNKKAFYVALARFVDSKEFDDLHKFVTEESLRIWNERKNGLV